MDGGATGVVMGADYHGAGGGGGGFAFTGNTGDYALLLNDAADVGTILQGGQLTYTFIALAPGTYEVFTYASNRAGIAIDTLVTIPGANPQTELVTGPMPGNALIHLVTHSVHRVEVDSSGIFQILFDQPPNMHTSMNLNGFQVVQVPETNSTIAVILGIALCLMRRRAKLDFEED